MVNRGSLHFGKAFTIVMKIGHIWYILKTMKNTTTAGSRESKVSPVGSAMRSYILFGSIFQNAFMKGNIFHYAF